MPNLIIGEQVVFEGVDVPFARVEHELVDGTTIVFDTRGINLSEGRRDLVVVSKEHLAGKKGTGNPRRSVDGTRVFQLDSAGIGEQRLPNGTIARVVLASGPLIEPIQGGDGRPSRWLNPAWKRRVEG